MIAKFKAQSFSSFVAGYSARHIAAAIGCSLPTAYDWRSGRRTPPLWLHARYIEDLVNYREQIQAPIAVPTPPSKESPKRSFNRAECRLQGKSTKTKLNQSNEHGRL